MDFGLTFANPFLASFNAAGGIMIPVVNVYGFEAMLYEANPTGAIVCTLLNKIKRENPQAAAKLWSWVSLANTVETVSDTGFLESVGDCLHLWEREDFSLSECAHAIAREVAAIVQCFVRMELNLHIPTLSINIDDEVFVDAVEAQDGGGFKLTIGEYESVFDDAQNFIKKVHDYIRSANDKAELTIPTIEGFPAEPDLFKDWADGDFMLMLYDAAADNQVYNQETLRGFVNNWKAG